MPADYTSNLTAEWVCADNVATTNIVAKVGSAATLSGGHNTSDIHAAALRGSLGSLTLNGTSDYFTIPSIILGGTDVFTLTALIKWASVSGFQTIFGNSLIDLPLLRSNGNKLEGGIDSFTVVQSNVNLSSGTLYLVSCSRDSGGNIKLGLNGVDVTTSGSSTSTQAWTANQIGREKNGVLDRYLKATVADIRYYAGRALSFTDLLGLNSYLGLSVATFAQNCNQGDT